MITNTDLLFKKLLEFQNKRKAATDNYDKRLTEIADTKGSKYFDDEAKKASDTKNAALDALRAEYGPVFDRTLQSMAETNGKRGITPPTEDELRLLQLLKMRDSVTETELEAAANTLSGNPTCLAALTEIAHKQGFLRGYMSYATSKEMPVDVAESTIKGLASAIRDFMEFDTPRAARTYQEFHDRRYGVDLNAAPLPKRLPFTDKAGCYKRLAGLSGDDLTAFCKAVD